MTLAMPCPKCGSAVGGPSDTYHLHYGKEGCPTATDKPLAVIRIAHKPKDDKKLRAIVDFLKKEGAYGA